MTDQDSYGVAVRALTSTAVQAVGMRDAGVGVVLAGVKEIVDPIFEDFLRRIVRRGERRAQLAVGVACDETGLTADELVDRLGRDDATLCLAREALAAAEATPLLVKIAAFGKVLANAARDDATVDDERMIVAALARLEAPHVQVLGVVCTTRGAQLQGIPVDMSTWNRGQIAEELPGHADVLDPILAVLTGQGLIREVDDQQQGMRFIRQSPSFVTTPFGVKCMERLSEVAELAELLDA